MSIIKKKTSRNELIDLYLERSNIDLDFIKDLNQRVQNIQNEIDSLNDDLITYNEKIINNINKVHI